MKILYDISVLGIGHYHSPARTGIFRVIENLANGLADSEEVDLNFCATLSLETVNQTIDYLQANPKKLSDVLFSTPGWQKNVIRKITDLINNINQKENININSKVIRKFFYSAANIIDQNTRIVNNNQLANIDLFHSPFHPIPEYIQLTKKTKKVLTVYDLIPILYPHFFGFNDDTLVKKGLNSLKLDNWVTCISHATKNDLCNYSTTIDPAQVMVTHLAASELFYPCSNYQKIESIKKKYQIPDVPYILSLSTLEPRKNIDHTIRCFARLVEQENIQDLYLVLVGTKGWDFDKIFEELAKSPKLKDRIIITGYVADEDLAPLYSGAMAFVYPSFYEGFGLPPLEAMQCGVPVITSNTSSLPEVVGDAGIMVAPTDTDALAQSILDIYNNSALRDKMSFKSIEQAKKFSWQKCTQQTIDAYKLALNS
jgi:glycosyltransferase involved in cell wall biosynthesis